MIRIWYQYKEQQACECGNNGYLVYECMEPEEAFQFVTKKGSSILIKCITKNEIELSVKAINKKAGEY